MFLIWLNQPLWSSKNCHSWRLKDYDFSFSVTEETGLSALEPAKIACTSPELRELAPLPPTFGGLETVFVFGLIAVGSQGRLCGTFKCLLEVP